MTQIDLTKPLFYDHNGEPVPATLVSQKGEKAYPLIVLIHFEDGDEAYTFTPDGRLMPHLPITLVNREPDVISYVSVYSSGKVFQDIKPPKSRRRGCSDVRQGVLKVVMRDGKVAGVSIMEDAA